LDYRFFLKRFLIILFIISTPDFCLSQEDLITHKLREYLTSVSDTEWVRVNIRFNPVINLLSEKNSFSQLGSKERRSFVINELKTRSNTYHTSFYGFLNNKSAEEYEVIYDFWILGRYTSDSLSR